MDLMRQLPGLSRLTQKRKESLTQFTRLVRDAMKLLPGGWHNGGIMIME